MNANWFKLHKTDLFVAAGIISMIGGTIAGIVMAPKWRDDIRKRKKELGVERLTVKEFLKVSWKPASVIVLSTVSGIILILVGHAEDKKVIAGYAVALSASEAANSVIKDKIVEVVGEKKATQIQEEIARDRSRQQGPVEEDKVYIVEGGDHLMRFAWNGWTFRSTVQKVEDAKNRLNAMLLSEDKVTVADLCYEFGKTPCDADSNYIWDPNKTGLIEFRKDGDLSEGDEPLLLWSFLNDPIYNPYY